MYNENKMDMKFEALSNLFKNPKDKLKEDIETYCKRNPEQAHELLTSVAVGLQGFKDSVNKSRSGSVWNNFMMVIPYILTSTEFNKKSNIPKNQHQLIKRRFHQIFDLMFYMFPNPVSDYTDQLESPKKLMNIFIEDYNFLYKNNPDERFMQWLGDIKGEEYVAWFQEVLKLDDKI